MGISRTWWYIQCADRPHEVKQDNVKNFRKILEDGGAWELDTQWVDSPAERYTCRGRCFNIKGVPIKADDGEIAGGVTIVD